MGWDIFCLLCGNSCHAPSIDNINDTDYTDDTDDTNNIDYTDLLKNTKWLNKCTFLLANNKILHGAVEIAYNSEFNHNGKSYEHISKYGGKYDIANLEYDNYGVFVHTDCWKFVKKEYNINLKYGDLFIEKNNLKDYYKVINIDYDKIEKYWGQDFKFNEIINDNNEYLCMSPLKNVDNAKRIKKIINKLKLRADDSRKSPSISASFYKQNTIKLGNDNNFWKIVKGKWIKMQGSILKKIMVFDKKDKKQMKMLESLCQIGEHSGEPIFVESFESLRSNKKKTLKVKIIYLKE